MASGYPPNNSRPTTEADIYGPTWWQPLIRLALITAAIVGAATLVLCGATCIAFYAIAGHALHASAPATITGQPWLDLCTAIPLITGIIGGFLRLIQAVRLGWIGLIIAAITAAVLTAVGCYLSIVAMGWGIYGTFKYALVSWAVLCLFTAWVLTAFFGQPLIKPRTNG